MSIPLLNLQLNSLIGAARARLAGLILLALWVAPVFSADGFKALIDLHSRRLHSPSAHFKVIGNEGAAGERRFKILDFRSRRLAQISLPEPVLKKRPSKLAKSVQSPGLSVGQSTQATKRLPRWGP